jgi:hypothetical protein
MFAYQLRHGVIERLGWSGISDPVLCHRCDWASCTNPAHLRLGTSAENSREWAQRRRDPTSPLADLRGSAGRSRAIAAAIREGLAAGDDTEAIERRLTVAVAAGTPLTLW